METVWIALSQLVLLHTVTGSKVNIALNKPVSMSSTRVNHHTFSDTKAVDGNKATDWLHIICTEREQPSAWFTVDLETDLENAAVKLFFRTDYKYHRNGVQLYTSTSPFSTYPSGQLCHTVTGRADGTDIDDVYKVTCPGSWRYLLLYTDTDNDGDGAVLDFAELQVKTKNGGNIAQGKPVNMSSTRTKAHSFNASNGVDGRTDGKWPFIVDTDESHRSAWWTLDLQRDVLEPTVKIYFRKDYNKRRNGVTLYTSTSPFSTYPSGDLCHTVTGRADGSDIRRVYSVTCPCRWRYLLLYTDTDNDGDGAVLDFAEVEVLVCSNGTYGEECTKTCSSRNCVTMTTTCERDGRCSEGCLTGWTGLDCTVCSLGVYGEDCTKTCRSRNCVTMTTTCERDGRCPDGCQSGWTGVDCTQECEAGSYGSACSSSCTDRKCLDQLECNHVTGLCFGGCMAGFKGTDCKQECPLGVDYGVSCEKSCSSRHCLMTPRVCDPQTGQCPEGCEPGWTGVDCTESDVQFHPPEKNHNNHPGQFVAAVGGTLLVVLLVVAGVIGGLIRQGRLRFLKGVHVSRDSSTHRCNITRQPDDVTEHANGQVYNVNFATLEAEALKREI